MSKQLKAVLLGAVGVVVLGAVAGLLIGSGLSEDKKSDKSDRSDNKPSPSAVSATELKNGEKVVTTESGLQYIDHKVGQGREAKPGNMVSVHYTGTLKDTGKQFDSSRGSEPIQFQIGTSGIIKGWNIGIAGMKVGGQRRLIIPSALAYGRRGRAPIPPDADLVFEVELMDIK